MASNVENSCKVWNCHILRPEAAYPDVIGSHGDIEHLRELLPVDNEVMEANTLYWITDRTLHEALLLNEGTCRQFFILVTFILVSREFYQEPAWRCCRSKIHENSRRFEV